jgi:hypothetical protein
MMNSRLLLAALLLSAPLLHAQDTQKIEAQKVEISLTPAKESAQPQAAQPQQEPKILREPFRITINFKTTDGSKITTQRSYSLVATTESLSPSIRDNSQVPIKFHETSYNTQHLKTNVDIRSFSKEGDSVRFGLAISTTDFAAGQDPNLPAITHDHEYTVSPTLPIGKLITVYSSVDAVNDSKVEVQVLVQPLNAK